MLKLLFQCVRAITKPKIDNRLIRAVYEIKTVQVNGEYPGVPTDRKFLSGTLRAVDHIVNSDIEHIFTFTVSDEVLTELLYLGDVYRKRVADKPFKSLETLENCMLKL